MSEKRGPWQVHGVEVKYENAWMRVDEFDATRPDGAPALYGGVHFQTRALAVWPRFENGDTLLVGQHRFPNAHYSWELPEGGGNPAADQREEAARELEEETGYRAKHWQEILRLELSNSISDETGTGFVATGLEPGRANPDPSEVLQTRRIAFRDLLVECQSGKISDSLTLVMVFKAYYMAREGLLEPELARAMLQG